MRRQTLLGTTLLAFAAGTGQAAIAADLVKTVPFSGVGPGSATVALPQFDPALGTLNAVTVTENASDQFLLDIFDSGAGSFAASAQNGFVFGLGGPPSQPGSVSAAGTIAAGMPVFTINLPAVSLGTVTLTLGPTADAPFIGTGTLDVSVTLSSATVPQFSGATVSTVLAFATASGAVTLDYAFTPTAPATIPEPASLAVLGAGLLGIGGIHIRHFRQLRSAASLR